MKKLILILLCLPMLTLAQKTYVPDDAFEQELINLGYDNVLDDSVMTASINTVTSLIFPWGSCIWDATGIEDFVSLSTLDIYECCMVDLDLSQNINLTSLFIDSTSSLQTLNLKNGNNLNMTIYLNSWSLQCINVDDVVWANNNWSSVLNGLPNAFFSEDCYIGRMEGYVYFDTDSSTTFDVSEAGLQNQVLELVDGNGVTQYVNTDNTGFFSSPVDSALSFTLSYYPLNSFYETSNNVSHTFQNIAYDSVLTALNFGVLSDESYLDAGISITKSFTLCNDTATIWIDVTNHGGTDIDGSFEAWVDNQTPITATSGSPVITNNHIEWSFTGLQTLQQIQQTINVVIPASPGVILIDSARVTPILPTNLYEFNTFNNFDEISDIVFCSMDPNDKKVRPEQCYYKSDEIMDYTIRFQNTGNYPAQKVRIIDTLDYNVLDVLSFQVVGASHDYTWQFKGSSVLEVIFDNIQLVDSSVSYVESQGFFKYQVQFKDNITALSESEMPAYIYFDYNQPVITNKPLAVYSETFNAIITQSPYNLAVQITDGALPFTYLWNTNEITQNINIQSNGNYWVIVTDANGCALDTLMYNVTGVGLDEINNERTLVRVIDLLGREVDIKKNLPYASFFFIYDDGSVEKHIIIE